MIAQASRSTLHAPRSTIRASCLVLLASCLLGGCATNPEKPEGTNIEFRRPTQAGNMLKDVDVLIKAGHVPLLTLQDGKTVYGTLNPGTYSLIAVSRDPYQFSEFSQQMWQSQPFQLVVEAGKYYAIELDPAEAATPGWVIKAVTGD